LPEPPATFRLDIVEVTFQDGGGVEVRHFENIAVVSETLSALKPLGFVTVR